MRHPWANIGLLVLVLVQVVSGFEGLVGGDEGRAWILWIHGMGAYAVLVLLFWKGSIVVESLARRRRNGLARALFLLLSCLLLASLGTGLLWTFGGRRLLSGYSLITVHILLSVVLFVIMAWHVSYMRFVFRVRDATGRRAFLRIGVAGLAGVALWQLAGRSSAALGLPGASRRFTGSYEVGSLSGSFPTVSWLFDRPGPVDVDSWRLEVAGEVKKAIAFSYSELLAMGLESEAAIVDCTGGWYSAQQWEGIRVGRLLDLAGIAPSALSVTFESVSGYGRRFPLEEARNCLLAMMVAGAPLDHGHGFPLRLVAPGRRGFDWVKWVARVRVNDTSSLLQPPLPLQ